MSSASGAASSGELVPAKPGLGRVALACMASAIVFLPFNSVPWFGGRLGELSSEGWLVGGVPLAAVYVLRAAAGRRLRYPRHASAWLLFAWLGWALAGAGASFLTAGEMEFKGRGLLEKLALQAAVSGFVLLLALATYEAMARVGGEKRILRAFRAYVALSLILPLLWALVEGVGLLAPDSGARDFVRLVSALTHSRVEYEARLRSVSGEASWFGAWLAFVLPWVLSAALSAGGRIGWAAVGALAVCVALTFSRFTWLVFLVLGAGFALSRSGLMGTRRAVLHTIGLLVGVVAAGVAGALTDPERASALLRSATLDPDTPHWVSNATRLGMQAAALRLAVSNPVLGVGWGAYGFHFEPFLPHWVGGNPEIEEYVADLAGTAWPSVHGLWARLAAETGFVGLALFAAAWVSFLWSAWKRARRAAGAGDAELCELWLALLWSGVGCALVAFALDSFRFGGYWLLLGTGWAAMRSERVGNTEERPSDWKR